MLKKIAAISFGLSMILTSAAHVEADNEKLKVSQEGTQTVVLSGCLGTENADKMIGARVFTTGYSAEDLKDLSKSEYINVVKFNDQTVTDADGNYRFEFDIDTGSQWITPYVGENIGGEEFNYFFVDENDWQNAADTINNAVSAAEIVELIEDDKYVLGLSDDDLKGISITGLASVLKETVKDEPLKADSRDASWLTIDKALFVQQLNQKKFTNLYSVDEEITQLDDSLIKEWYNKAYVTEALQLNFTERLSNKNIVDYEAYKEKITDAFILATVQYPNGISNVSAIMTAFADRIGISVNNVSNVVWSNLAGKDYENLTALKNAFNNYKNNTGSQGQNNTGGGGGGGGSSSGGGGGSSAPSVGGLTISAENTATVKTPIPTEIFSDISNVDWAREAIIALAEKQIINGVGNGLFEPDGNVTREQFAKIVVGAFVSDSEEAEVPFADVSDSEWYAPFIKKAYSKGIVNGVSADSFGVGMPITRQDMCVMIYKAAVSYGISFNTAEPKKFADDALIADYAKEAVYALRDCGAVNGVNDTDFAPLGNATRAEAAKIIYYLMTEM